ncbi:hypothetical protein [Microbulbifer discodermiae]|uniref:hypothetical protein n=1 Tax=Microbulbifer sp. 2201CG32-9 TaxID=3232309 RepID=UPI00345C38B8
MQCREQLDFIRQVLMDFGGTLPVSARVCYEPMAQRHFDALAAALADRDEKKNEFSPAGDKPIPDLD